VYTQRDPNGRSYHVIGEDEAGDVVVTKTKWKP